MLFSFAFLLIFVQVDGFPPDASFPPQAEVTGVNLPTTSLPVTTIFSNNVPLVQSTTTNAQPRTTGDIHSLLETLGRASVLPFDTSSQVPYASNALTLVPSSSLSPPSSIPTVSPSENIFTPVAVSPPPQNIAFRSDHPAQAPGLVHQNSPLHTNKFYANMFLGTQNNPVWTHPYSIQWSKGGGDTQSWGFSVSHVERNQLQYGQGKPPSGAPQYFINPVGIQNIVLSATELGNTTVLTTDSHQAFSVNANLAPKPDAIPIISCPLVQGMGFVTAVYNQGTVLLQSGVYFSSISMIGVLNNNSTFKYRVVLEDKSNWLLYVTPMGAAGIPPFVLQDSTTIHGPAGFQGTVQIAKNPAGAEAEVSYDKAAGVYAISASITGSATDKIGNYKITWNKAGQIGQSLLMFALPHHLDSFVSELAACATEIQLITTTKGKATAFLTNYFEFSEPDLPVDIGFDPWSPTRRNVKTVPVTAAKYINAAAGVELAQNIDEQSNLNSMYYSGKALSKFASIVYATNQFAGNSSLASAGLKKLEAAFATFVYNKQFYPLVYDAVWRGVVSSSSYISGNPNDDFGNSYYNDHHFHYGYFVHAAAVIGYLDPDWLNQGTNKDWVNMLIRDYANGVDNDPFFPFSRSFDWYHGHSWAKGIFESVDGKDEESTSEDTFASFAMKMWGRVIGDANMEARGNLQLAVLARSLRNYFLLASDNRVQPVQFIPNKVTGILFENKADHTTYFGSATEYIQGIHMIPISPVSAYTRPSKFVAEEWDLYFADRNSSDIQPGWGGILMANLATIDPNTSWKFFSNPNFDMASLDGGASLTWYLTWAAGLGGVD